MYDNISEGQFLIKLLATAINNSPIECPDEDFSWENLYNLASFHSVANTAFYGLQNLPDISVIPPDIYNKFSAAAKKHLAMEALQQFEIRQIFQRFEHNQIFCVPLDGHVIKGYYPRPDMRCVLTLNILIEAKSKSKIHVILNSLGYTLVNTTPDRINYLKDGNINLSLRTSLLPERPQYSEYFSKIQENIQPKTGLRYIGALKPEEFYVYTMAHLAHMYASGGAGIRAVLDVWVLLKRLSPTLDREYINQQLNKLDIYLFAFYIEELSKIWFDENTRVGENTDNEIYDQMRTHIFENYKSKSYEKYSENLRKETERMAKEDAAVEKAKVSDSYRSKIFPPLDKMKTMYPMLSKMPFLLPIYWLIRIVTLFPDRK